MMKNYAKPGEASRLANSIHKDQYRPVERNHNGWTDSLMLGNNKVSGPTEEKIYAGRVRRACEIIDEARQLGRDELLEVWEE